MDSELQRYLTEHHIKYIEYTHPAVFTVAEAEVYCAHVPGLPCKNLFLKSKEKETEKEIPSLFLVIVPGKKRVNLVSLTKQLQVKKLTFGSEQELYNTLKLTPGAVSPFGLIHDINHHLTVLIDEEVWNAGVVNFHPNVNTSSLALLQENFHRFIASTGHKYLVQSIAAVN